MTGRQRSKLAMFTAVGSVCAQYRHVWRQLPAFRNACERFEAELAALTKVAKSHRRDTGGAAQEKVRVRAELCALGFEVAAAVRASAMAAGDDKAAGKLAFSLTQLRIGKDSVCLERCGQILVTAESHGLELEAFGLTRQKLAELAHHLQTFTTMARETRAIRSANKAVTSQLPALFKTAEETVYNQLDNLIPQFRTVAPRFFAQYQEARVMKRAVELPSPAAEAEAEDAPMLD